MFLHCYTDLISCTRHLSVKSSIRPVHSSCQLSAMDRESWEGEEEPITEEEEEDFHGENCQECKQKVQGALTDTLPPTVAEGEGLSQSLKRLIHHSCSQFIFRVLHHFKLYRNIWTGYWYLNVIFFYDRQAVWYISVNACLKIWH